MMERAEPPGKADETVDATGVAMRDVEEALGASWTSRLRLSRRLESAFHSTTRHARILNTRLTVPVGICCYASFAFVDSTLFPDLGWLPDLVRGLVFPIGLFVAVFAPRFSSMFRETYCGVAMSLTMCMTLGLMTASAAPDARYATLIVILVNLFGCVTLRIRFGWACLLAVLCLAGCVASSAYRGDWSDGVERTILLSVTICSVFCLLANNRLEHAERRSFLLSLRDALRTRDIEREREAFSMMSFTDVLTGLPNRRAFDERLAALWEDMTANGRGFSLLMIDVDTFKRFNDVYGHVAGDACLATVGRALSGVTFDGDTLVARYGGEEFAVLLKTGEPLLAARHARAVSAAVRAVCLPHVHGVRGVVTVSVGAATATPGRFAAPVDVVAEADRLLYSAKSDGRDRVASVVLRELPHPELLKAG